MAVVTMRQLLESGVHFGHQTRRWNPKMKRFIFTEAQRHLHHRSSAVAVVHRSCIRIREGNRRARWIHHVRRH